MKCRDIEDSILYVLNSLSNVLRIHSTCHLGKKFTVKNTDEANSAVIFPKFPATMTLGNFSNVLFNFLFFHSRLPSCTCILFPFYFVPLSGWFVQLWNSSFL